MSTISSTGLVSGLPISDLIDALMSVHQQPLIRLQGRLSTMVSQRTALIQISANLLSIQNIASRLATASTFDQTATTSSDESILLATSSTGASPGQYTFTVRNLAAAHQVISSGFATQDSTLVGAGTFTIETSAALLNRSTALSALNGGDGVGAGHIRITDRAGNGAEIDLRSVSTIQDVVSAINSQSSADVLARVEGDHLVLEDQTGLTSGDLVVAEVGNGTTAADLGLLVSHVDGVITGGDLVALAFDTRLDDINDGNGVNALKAQKDFRITLADGTALEYDLSARLSVEYRDNGDGTFTDLSTPLSVLNGGAGVSLGVISVTNRAGEQVEIDLSAAETIRDVTTAAGWAEADMTVTVSGSHLVITDNSTGDGSMLIEDTDGTTASALGIDTSASSGTLTGDDIFFVETIGDVVRLINAHADNTTGSGVKVMASISTTKPGLTLTDVTSGGGTFTVEGLNGSDAAEDLGIAGSVAGNTIESRRLLAGLDTTLLRSLNGGSGVTQLGDLQLTDRNGDVAVVNLSSAETLADVIAAINAAPTDITASVSASSLGIQLTDSSGGTGSLVIADLGGSTVAADLNIAFDGTEDKVASGNLQRQYVSAASRLSTFGANGVPAGKFRITDSTGAAAVVDLTQGNEVTLQDVIDEINSRPIGVVASINATGDGLLLEDSAGGTGVLTVAEEGGTTAQALGILGSASDGKTFIDGTFETRLTIDSGDTLTDVIDKIRESGARVNAAIINDGSGSKPYRLSLTSLNSGISGGMAIDAGATGLDFATLTNARDAKVLFGSPDAEAPLVLTSSTNTLSDAIAGVRLDLVSAADEPVTITVSRDTDTIVSDLSGFVAAFNAAVSSIDNLTRYDTETETRAVLTGDATARRARQRLIGLVNRTIDGLPPTMNRLADVGITLTGGSSLSFDEDAFRKAWEENPAAVAELFTHEVTDDEDETTVTGFGGVIDGGIAGLIEATTGVIPIREQAMQTSEKMLNNRIEQLSKLLEGRRARLMAQFNAMEMVIAQLQSQQTALAGIMSLSITQTGSAS